MNILPASNDKLPCRRLSREPMIPDKMQRPKINIELDAMDKLVQIIGVIGIIVLIGLPVLYYDDLPNTIPTHFGVSGQADDYTGKAMIWMLPVIGVVLYVIMSMLNSRPHLFNYPTLITEENARRQYTIASKMIRLLNAIIMCVLAYLAYSSIHIGLGTQSGLGSNFILIFMIVMLSTTGYFLYKSISNK